MLQFANLHEIDLVKEEEEKNFLFEFLNGRFFLLNVELIRKLQDIFLIVF